MGDYTDSTTTIESKDYTVQVTITSGGFTKTFETDTTADFSATQFHFHAPSEHTVDGKYYDLEMHVVHHYAGEPTRYGSVIGVFFDVEEGGDGTNLFLQQLSSIFAGPGGAAVGATDDVQPSMRGFMDSLDITKFYSYDGSLTTPPCSEGIKWNIVADI